MLSVNEIAAMCLAAGAKGYQETDFETCMGVIFDHIMRATITRAWRPEYCHAMTIGVKMAGDLLGAHALACYACQSSNVSAPAYEAILSEVAKLNDSVEACVKHVKALYVSGGGIVSTLAQAENAPNN